MIINTYMQDIRKVDLSKYQYFPPKGNHSWLFDNYLLLCFCHFIFSNTFDLQLVFLTVNVFIRLIVEFFFKLIVLVG